MKQLVGLKIIAVGALLLCLASCQSSEKKSDVSPNTDGGFSRAKTLYLGGFQWGDPNSFNPVCDLPAFPVGGNFNLMYEPLLVYNTINGKIQPLLGRSLEQTNDAISVVLDPRARWSDGKPVTALDVRYTFELGKRFKAAPTAYVWDYIADITVEKVNDSASGTVAEKINFLINKKVRNNPLVVLDILQNIRIVPAHIIDSLLVKSNNSLAELQKLKMDKAPVVSGPYNLLTYSPEKIVLKRRDDYWGNAALHQGRLPKPQYIIHSIYKSNDAFSVALQQGDLDVSATFIPRVWMKVKEGVGTWFDKAPYFVPATIPMLTINCTRYPLSDKRVRRAMAFAINYKDISELAVSGYSPAIKSGLILPFGAEERYFSAEASDSFGVTFDPAKARQIMKDAGFTPVWDKEGKLDHVTDAQGKKVPTMYVKSPAGWSDWEAMVQIAVKEMRAAGIDVREGFCDAGLYWQSQPVGDFDLVMQKPTPAVSPSKPWSRFEAVMSSRNWTAPGEKMNENQGRYNKPGSKEYNKKVDSLLKAIPTITDSVALKSAYRMLNTIFMQDQPTLPLAYLPEQFYEFSVKHWTNFPTAAQPYAPPQCLCYGAGTASLWEIVAVSAK